MTMYAMALPIKPDKIDEWRRFAADVTGPHRADWQDQLRSAGISAEQVFHQQTPDGHLAVVVWECEDADGVLDRMSKPHNDFAAQRLPSLLADVHGIDLASPPAPSTLVGVVEA